MGNGEWVIGTVNPSAGSGQAVNPTAGSGQAVNCHPPWGARGRVVNPTAGSGQAVHSPLCTAIVTACTVFVRQTADIISDDRHQ
ncbi:MAG: hypothetical protein HC789_00465 [Microcoleus sp. CSU_2_2]|nr:hypothetical protein [Microcoleus sp. CSU_2_2]